MGIVSNPFERSKNAHENAQMTDNERKLLLHVAELLDGWSSNLDSLVGAVNEETRLRPTPSFTAMSLEDIAYYAGVEERMKKYREERDAQMAKMNSPEGKKAANEAGRAAERAQQAPMTATRAQVLAEAEQVARSVGQLHEEHQQELKRLFEAQQRRELHLQLESDRRARSVAEAIIERVVQIGITERKAIEDINIDAIVTGTKHT